ncbi:unnamed protein product [Laminaria digitata]
MRSPNMIKSDRDRQCPYSFPLASRRKMVSDILDHHVTKDDEGRWRLAWSISVPHDLAHEGRVGGDKIHDEAWVSHYASNPEVFHQTQISILEDFLTGNAGTWPKSDAGRYEFSMTSSEDAAELFLDKIDGVEIAFTGKAGIGVFLDELGDSGIRDMWKLVRVLDHDLSPASLESSFRKELSRIRVLFEEGVDQQPERSPE